MVDDSASRARRRPLHPGAGLPEEIIIWEILVRLPPNALLRCSAVCRAWRHATTTRDFLLAHHARQPTLPLLYGYDYHYGDNDSLSIDFRTLDTRAAGIAAADLLQPLTRFGDELVDLEASCDGLLILYLSGHDYAICNLTTRQFAPLPLLSGFTLVGMYPHGGPTGDYRLLLYTPPKEYYEDEPAPDAEYACHIFALGSCQPPRNIGWPEAAEAIRAVKLKPAAGFLFRGGLHWHLVDKKMIMAFDTTAESFRKMPAPVVLPGDGDADLFDMDGMLGVSCFNREAALLNVWVMEDYESEVWAMKYRVELPGAELSKRFPKYDTDWKVVTAAAPFGRDMVVLIKSGWDRHPLQVCVGSKLVASFQDTCLCPTGLQLKQTLVPHTFFPKLDGYAVNASPFLLSSQDSD